MPVTQSIRWQSTPQWRNGFPFNRRTPSRSTGEPFPVQQENPHGKKISLRATGDELGISLRGVRRLISSGELRAYKVGKGAVRIDVDDIAAVLKPIILGVDVAPTPPQFVRNPYRRVHQDRKAERENKTRRTA
jgi:excisionase family DNA binding protein